LAADGKEHVAQAIAGLRNRLLAEHCGVDPQRVADSLAETGSLLATLSAFDKGERFLQDLPLDNDTKLSELLSADEIVDPERPIDAEPLLNFFGFGAGKRDESTRLKHKAWRFAAVMALALLLAALWRWSPLNQWLNMDRLLAAADTLRESPLAVPTVLALYVLGSCLMFPITVLILATALSFGPLSGFALALTGSLLGGWASYLLGRWLGRDAVRKLAGEKLNRLSRKISRRGWLAVAVVRVVPIAPFTIVNLVAGSTHISGRSFLIGTAVGMGPGILAIMIFESGLEQALRDPGWGSLALAVIALCAALTVLVLGRSWLTGREERHEQ
ncbi:MAG TPA: TVP38/TMEM64 family protein, partial [Geopsychrobacteraceae bacterium]